MNGFQYSTLGGKLRFESVYWNFCFDERIWKEKIIVAHANGTNWKKASAVMVTVNIVQTIDFLMIAANVGNTQIMNQ